jgi:AcrR family transcriptional regulator
VARTKAADYDEKRNLIMEKAAHAFARDSFAAASLSSLAEACGVSKSLIYHYYRSKEAILYDVMSGHIDELMSAIEGETPADAAGAARRLRAFTRELLRLYAGAADKQKVLLYELGALPEAQHREIVDKQRRLIDFVETLLRAAAPALSQDHAHLRAKTMLYFGMLNWTHTWMRDGGPVSRDEVADMATELLLGSPD